MNDTQAMATLIAHVNASAMPVNIGWDEVMLWPESLLEQFRAHGLVTKDVNAKSLTCLGCEHRCTMDVLLTEDAQRAFIVCDHPDMQGQMGRIPVALERLQQWQASTRRFAILIAAMLGLDTKPSFSKETTSYKLGMLNGKEGRRWASLFTRPLRLEIAGHFVPIGDLLFFDGGELVIDLGQVKSLLASSPLGVGKAYTPNTNKQDARKMVTQVMYQNWRDEYQALLLKHPDKTDGWYSKQIAKLSIGNNKQPETIRKHMKG